MQKKKKKNHKMILKVEILTLVMLILFNGCEVPNESYEFQEPNGYSSSYNLSKKGVDLETVNKMIDLIYKYDIAEYNCKNNTNEYEPGKFYSFELLDDMIEDIRKKMKKISDSEYNAILEQVSSKSEDLDFYRNYLDSFYKDFQNSIKLKKGRNEIVKIRDGNGNGEVKLFIEYTELGIKLQAYRYCSSQVKQVEIKNTKCHRNVIFISEGRKVYKVNKTEENDNYIVVTINNVPFLIVLGPTTKKKNPGIKNEMDRIEKRYKENYKETESRSSICKTINIDNKGVFYSGRVYADIYRTGEKKYYGEVIILDYIIRNPETGEIIRNKEYQRMINITTDAKNEVWLLLIKNNNENIENKKVIGWTNYFESHIYWEKE